MRSGSADLPLHGGHVPKWLADRMTVLGRVLCEAIVLQYGAGELLRRLAHPFWFQSLGCVMGMDWHSSGITTSVIGALKRGLRPVEHEIGVFVCGGRGKHSRKTPEELAAVGEKTGLDAAKLAAESRLVAKVDGAALQDGFDLYLHGFFVARDGSWTVVQQGMNGHRRLARRYHWLSRDLRSFVDEPHAAIEGEPVGEIVNLVDRRAKPARDAQVDLVHAGPDRVLAELRRLTRASSDAQRLLPFPGAAEAVQARAASEDVAASPEAPHLRMPGRHHLLGRDVVSTRLHAALAAAHERGPVDFADVLATPGVGARTVFALALVAEVVHGAPSRFSDPARFSLAHGGKDGHPYPVPLRVYDETIRVMKRAVSSARIGQGDRLFALERLDVEARRIERAARLEGRRGPPLEAFVADERAKSASYGGRTVFGPAEAPPAPGTLGAVRPRRSRAARADEGPVLRTDCGARRVRAAFRRMKLYHQPRTRSSRVRWLLAELGVVHEVEHINVFAGEGRRPEYFGKIHPHGCVPALEDGGPPIIESAAICMYLVDRYGHGRFAPPPGTEARGKYYEWMVYVPATADPVCETVMFHTIFLPEAHRLPQVAERSRTRWAKKIEPRYRHALGQSKYVLGDEFSAADVLVGHSLLWARTAGILSDDPVLATYLDEITARPAFIVAHDV